MQLSPGKRVTITDKQLERFNTMNFKKRADLQNFHLKHPGALGAMFVKQVRQLMGLGLPKDTKDLAQTDPTMWVHQSGCFKESRDQKEALFLTRLLSELGRERYAQVADLLTQRLRELRLAKKDGMTWDSARFEGGKLNPIRYKNKFKFSEHDQVPYMIGSLKKNQHHSTLSLNQYNDYFQDKYNMHKVLTFL